MLKISTCRKSRPSKGRGGEGEREKKFMSSPPCDFPKRVSIHKLWGSHRHWVKVCVPDRLGNNSALGKSCLYTEWEENKKEKKICHLWARTE